MRKGASVWKRRPEKKSPPAEEGFSLSKKSAIRQTFLNKCSKIGTGVRKMLE
jgi:hypothetical protein